MTVRRISSGVFLAIFCLLATLPSSPVIGQEGAKPAAAAPNEDPLLRQIDEALAISKTRELDGRVHTPWQIVHGILGLRQDFIIKVDGEKLTAIDWLSTRGATYLGEPYFQKTEFGLRGHPFTKPMLFEGHPTQFLAYLSMAGLPQDYPIKVGEQSLTVADIVRDAQKQVRAGEEPGWTLWALSHYLGADATWQNKSGENWSVERLARSQVYEPVLTGACGGTHGLFSLTYARNQMTKTGTPLRGIWLEADQKIRRYVEEPKSMQSTDGSFSADFFKGRRAGRDVNERLGPSGHTLEFVVLAVPDSRLSEPWLRNAVHSVSSDLISSRSIPLPPAPLYHATDALILYRNRVRNMAAGTTTAGPGAATGATVSATSDSAVKPSLPRVTITPSK